MFCKFCNEPVGENETICPNCGLSQNDNGTIKDDIYICPVCGAENPPGERKCKYCCSLFPENSQ